MKTDKHPYMYLSAKNINEIIPHFVDYQKNISKNKRKNFTAPALHPLYSLSKLMFCNDQ